MMRLTVICQCVLQLVLALYPQTTCFYRAVVHEPPKRVCSDLIAFLMHFVQLDALFAP